MSKRVLWVVDFQRDFFLPNGALYIRSGPRDDGAVWKIETIKAMVREGLRFCDQIVMSADWHYPEDPELSETPDFVETFPPHCMAGTEGAQILHGTVNGKTFRIKRTDGELPPDDTVLVSIEKALFDVFAGNPLTDAFVRSWSAGTQVYVAGGATDVCVKYAVEGLVARDCCVTVFKDAVHGLGIIPSEELFEAWRGMGVVVR